MSEPILNAKHFRLVTPPNKYVQVHLFIVESIWKGKLLTWIIHLVCSEAFILKQQKNILFLSGLEISEVRQRPEVCTEDSGHLLKLFLLWGPFGIKRKKIVWQFVGVSVAVLGFDFFFSVKGVMYNMLISLLSLFNKYICP